MIDQEELLRRRISDNLQKRKEQAAIRSSQLSKKINRDLITVTFCKYHEKPLNLVTHNVLIIEQKTLDEYEKNFNFFNNVINSVVFYDFMEREDIQLLVKKLTVWFSIGLFNLFNTYRRFNKICLLCLKEDYEEGIDLFKQFYDEALEYEKDITMERVKEVNKMLLDEQNIDFLE